MTDHQEDANWNAAEWHGEMLVDREGEKIGKLQDVYVDVENDEPHFATRCEPLPIFRRVLGEIFLLDEHFATERNGAAPGAIRFAGPPRDR